MSQRSGNLDGFLGLGPLAPYLVGSGEQAQAQALRGLPHAQAFLNLRSHGDSQQALSSTRRGQRAYETLGPRPKAQDQNPAAPAHQDDTQARESAFRKILGLSPSGQLTEATLQQAYRRALKRAHPDTGGSPQAFHAVQQAYESLRPR
ncbi:MAG: J domain-containing protein [Pseudomonadales bacterium]|nr:J domain-containing protein [Pseudomonadales bacterium]